MNRMKFPCLGIWVAGPVHGVRRNRGNCRQRASPCKVVEMSSENAECYLYSGEFSG